VKLTALLVVIGLVAITGPAWAPCYFTSFTGNADCEGWVASGAVTICGDYDTLGYVVTLSKGGEEVARFADHFLVTDAVPTFNFNVPWGMDLCGDYVVNGHFFYVDPIEPSEHFFEVRFTCDCDEPDGECHYTPGYWKNHPEMWPASALPMSLGGVSYNQDQLIAILRQPVRGDALVILKHHLIAAILNVANGADDSINDEIAEALAILMAPGAYTRDEILAAKDALADYNEMILPDCEGYIAPPVLFNRALGTSAAPNTESATWGAIKNIYR